MITYGSTTLTSYNSIVKTEVYYYKSTSATSLSGGSWSTTKPTWENGKYIWQKIRTVYEDGTHTESDPVNITGQQGATGTAAYSYKLNSSDSIIGKTKDGEYTIKKITFSATYKQGTGAVSTYSGRFKIESTINGSTWKTEYTSSGNESSKAFTIPNDIIAIKCSLYQSDGTTVLLDIVTVPVVKDGVDAIGLRDSIPYYLASDKDTGITRLTQGWTRYRPQLTAEKKYLWVYYVSRYSEGSTEPELIEIKDDLVHFVNNGDESPVESCVVDIEPVQDLHGYDSPWPAGGGKNILNVNSETWDKYNVSQPFWGYNAQQIVKMLNALKPGTYTFTFHEYVDVVNNTGSGTYGIILRKHVNGVQLDIDARIFNTAVTTPKELSKSVTFTLAEDDVGTFTYVYLYSGFATQQTQNSAKFYDFQLELGSTATTYEPYENICPITGWTKMKITRTGKNLLNTSDPDYDNYTIGPDGAPTLENTRIATGFIPCGEGVQLIFSTNQKTDGVGTAVQFAFAGIAAYDKDKNFLTRATVNNKRTVTFTTPTGTKYVRAFEQITICGSSVTVTPTDFATYEQQLELGSTATDYEPYSGQTYDITFPTEAGTVYGGTLDVTKGELVVDRAMVELPSDMSWATWGVNYQTSGITGFYIYRYSMPSTLDFSNIRKAVLTNLLPINHVWGGSAVGYGTNTGGSAVAPSNWYETVSICNESANILSTDTKAEAVAKFKAFLASTPLNVLYELAEPITYTLTPQEITMLCKENNLWTDTGQTAISYYDNQTSTDPYVDYSLTSAFDASTIEPAYIETEWVESTGKQYVYLDWKPPIKTWGFEIDFICRNLIGTTGGNVWNEETNANGYGTIFGTRNASAVNDCMLTSYATGYIKIGGGSISDIGFERNKRIVMKMHDTTFTKPDGTTKTLTRLNETANKPYWNMTVFAYHQGLRQASYGGVTEPSSTRIYSLKFFDGDTLTVDLVGAIRKSDRTTGLYDKVSKHFYPAPGLLYGNEVGDIGEIASIKQSMLKTNPQTIVVNKNRTRMWEATVPFDHLEDGQKLTVTYSYGNVVNSVETEKLAGWTDTSSNQQVYLKLTLSNGNQTDWIPCYYSNTGRLTTHYGSGIPIVFTYRENMLAGASETSSGYAVMRGFYADANYDSNTIYTQYASAVKAGTNGVKRYTLIMRDSDNTYSSFINQANTLGTTKTAYTGGFVLGKVYYSSGGAEYATGANTSSIWSTYQVDLRYDFNITTSGATALTLYKPVYLVGTVHDDDGLFYLDTTQWWTQTEPTSEDGKVYVFIGQAYSAYQSWLAVDNTAYQYYDGKFMPYETVRTLKSITTLQETLENQIDGKIETWCQINDPATAWTTADLKNQHDGDLWYYTGESTSSYKNNTTYKYTASTNKWTAYSASTDLFDKIDAKASIYYGKPSAITQNLEVGDYLVDSTDGCSYRWDGSKWVKLTDYNAAIDAIEIGGKNLLRGTKTQDTSLGNYRQNVTATEETLFGCTVFTSSDRWADIGFNFKTQILDRDLVKAGDSVTYSIWAKTDDTEPRNIMGVWVGGYYSGTTIAVLSSEWTQYSKTFIVTEEMLEATSAVMTRFECNTDCTEGKYIYWAAPKLERGTKATDWTLAPEDTEAEISALQEDLQSQIDEKIQTYYQSTNPASAWTTADIRATHDGDLWCYIGTTTSTYTKDNVYRYNASNNTWTTYSASGDLFDKVDGKTTVFYGKTTDTFTDVETGDYLVDATDGSSYRYDGSKWVKVTDYQAAIDNMSIGGRNLLKWTAKPKANGTYYKKNPEETDGWYAWNASIGAITETDNGIKFTHNSSTTSAGIVIPLVSLNAVIGEIEYVLSFKYRTNLTSIGSPYLLCQTDGNISYSQAISIIQSEAEWKYFNYKIQWSSSSGRNTWAILIPYINTSNGWIEIQNGSMKLEKGTKATDWTPAPEDIDASIATAQTTADEALAATQPISSKTFTDIIGTANDIANASFYFAKVHPTTYTDPWMVKMKIKASVPSDTNFRKTVDITIHGCRSNFISYDSIVANYNSNPIYYLNLYRATQAGIETNKKGHALGFGLRSATSPTDTNKKRTFEVDLLEVDGCTVDWIDPPVKYADMDGTGSTNYVGCTELGITSNGQNATNNGNTYDRIKYSTIKAAEAIARYNIIVGTNAGYKHLKSGTPWDITYPILYADAALNANATGSSNYLTVPFTVTTTQSMTLTPYKPVYIEGTLEGTTFTPIDTTPLTQTVPTSDNGHQYILLGSAYSTTAINLEAEHPIYQFQNGNFVTVAEAASRIGANAENLIKATYAVCSTAAGTNAKTADCTNFELYEGARIQVTFTNANTASAPTLNINNTGAKAIYINKTAASNTNQLLWTAGSKMEFVYDGTGWVAQNVPYALYGTCSTGASTAAKAVTCNEAVICKGTTISVNMTNTNTAANATINVGSTAAKDIYANGVKLTTNSRFNWRANTTQKFVFDGQVWRMDDDSVKALATAYITEIDDDGIMVHPEDDSTSGWAISDAIQLFKNGISYIKLWIENNIPKIRIGKEDQGHIILDNDSVDIRNDNTVLASFGATSVIGDTNDWHQTIAANQITFAKGDDIITYISPDKLYTINAEVADAFYISNYSIRNASDGKLVIGLRR